MICFPNCKINIGLFITEKRNDNYHNIETVFYPVPLYDVLEIVKSKHNQFTVSGLEIDGNENSNLIIKSYNILKEKFKLPPLNIYLHKIIPMGAGLGGGSSNAAFMVKLLNDSFLLNISNKQMIEIVGKIGSDCPFFIENKVKFASEKGDSFKNINLNLSNYNLLIVKPSVNISTQIAYSLIKQKKPSFNLENIDIKDIDNWKNYVINDFEEPLFLKFPKIKAVKEKLYNLGAVYASMSGSGSAVYGVFKNPVNTSNLFNDCFVWQGKLN